MQSAQLAGFVFEFGLEKLCRQVVGGWSIRQSMNSANTFIGHAVGIIQLPPRSVRMRRPPSSRARS